MLKCLGTTRINGWVQEAAADLGQSLAAEVESCG
jgi:hypothetical protein